jgi:hypothetical protein
VADRLIAELFERHPEARFRITQAAFVQEHALREAQNRIQDLEWQVQAGQAQAQAQQSRGLFGFGAPRQPNIPPRPSPLPAGPGAQAMAANQGRPGFLGGALATAAGVAGGILLGNALMSMFAGSGAAQAATPDAAAAAETPRSPAGAGMPAMRAAATSGRRRPGRRGLPRGARRVQRSMPGIRSRSPSSRAAKRR